MTISFARHQFPPSIIRHAVWLNVRFTLSYRDVEDLLAERGLGVSYETVRRWVLKFGPLFAAAGCGRRSSASDPLHVSISVNSATTSKPSAWKSMRATDRIECGVDAGASLAP